MYHAEAEESNPTYVSASAPGTTLVFVKGAWALLALRRCAFLCDALKWPECSRSSAVARRRPVRTSCERHRYCPYCPTIRGGDRPAWNCILTERFAYTKERKLTTSGVKQANER
jgi:hypothetical protein